VDVAVALAVRVRVCVRVCVADAVRLPVRDDDDELEGPSPLPAGSRNYITPNGYTRLKTELKHLLDRERPDVVKAVSWAASNGDRSENADYIYGKRRLREIDRRIRFLTKRLDLAEIVDPAAREWTDQVFFGATVRIAREDDSEQVLSIVGIDEIDTERGRISWVSPMARALTKAREGDTVTLHTPAGVEDVEIVEVNYLPIE
jgi:transcription elongation factor GreB